MIMEWSNQAVLTLNPEEARLLAGEQLHNFFHWPTTFLHACLLCQFWNPWKGKPFDSLLFTYEESLFIDSH